MNSQITYFAYIIIGHFVLFSAAESEQNETSGLRCYACAETGGDNLCEKFNTYKTAMDGEGNGFIKKNCIYPFNVTCVIEIYAALGNTVSHIRDCSDGEHFSFTSSQEANRSVYRRLEDLVSNNETACVWNGKHQVCLSKCDTNFCNGPRLKEVNDAAWIKISTSLLVFLIIANIFQ